MKRIKIICFIFFAFIVKFNAQNTVGAIKLEEGTHEGYTLFSIHKKSFLINNCGQVIKSWDSTIGSVGSSYLLPNGNLLRVGDDNDNPNFNFGGSAGIIEIFNWDGDLLWQYKYSNENHRQHHDVYPMPNGNILILAATKITNEDAIQAGRDPSKISGDLYNEQIIEITPIGTDQANIVWEWNIKDHLIQDFNSNKDNFGDVASHPEKLDINFLNGGNGEANWLHINSIQFDEDLNQILISSRNLSEIWAIDHSTTTEESASNNGGFYGKGGDILYRWGNPQSYKQGTENDRKLYGQHFPHYVRNTNTDKDGKIILFNNGLNRQPLFSEVVILSPPIVNGFYNYDANTSFGPDSPDFSYSDDSEDPSPFFSAIVSSAQVLPNNNVLICEGFEGRFFEIDENNNKVWEYVNPVAINGDITDQGSVPTFPNLTFRAIKYSENYSAFTGRELLARDTIENNFNSAPCTGLNIDNYNLENFIIYPNPFKNKVNLSIMADKIEIFNVLGMKIKTFVNSKELDLSDLNSGILLLKIYFEGKTISKKIIKN